MFSIWRSGERRGVPLVAEFNIVFRLAERSDKYLPRCGLVQGSMFKSSRFPCSYAEWGLDHESVRICTNLGGLGSEF